jgi:energy-coupling factor transporter ATP-binding protein EcfA2
VLDTMTLTQFKAHSSLDVALSTLTVLIGPNGCGKSTVLEGLWCLGKLAEGAPSDMVFSGPRALAEIRAARSAGEVALTARGTLEGSPYVAKWSVQDGRAGDFMLTFTDGTPTPIRSFDDLLAPDPRLVAELAGVVWRLASGAATA